jgi:hypothetical protein
MNISNSLRVIYPDDLACKASVYRNTHWQRGESMSMGTKARPSDCLAIVLFFLPHKASVSKNYTPNASWYAQVRQAESRMQRFLFVYLTGSGECYKFQR